MNYGQLKTRLAGSIPDSYTHRDDLTTAVLDDLIDQARERIGADLRARDNLIRESLAFTAGVATIPTLYRRMVSLEDAQGIPLKPTSTREFALLSAAASGRPLVYQVTDTQVRVAPAATETMTIEYFGEPPAFTADGDVVPHQGLFIFASMVELALFLDDMGRHDIYEARYQERVKTMNSSYALAERAIGRSQYDYSRASLGV